MIPPWASKVSLSTKTGERVTLKEALENGFEDVDLTKPARYWRKVVNHDLLILALSSDQSISDIERNVKEMKSALNTLLNTT